MPRRSRAPVHSGSAEIRSLPDGEDFSLTQPGQAGYSRKAAAVQMKTVPKATKPSAQPLLGLSCKRADLWCNSQPWSAGSQLGAAASAEEGVDLPAALTELEAMFVGQLDAGIVREVLLGLGGNTEAACDALLQLAGQNTVAAVSKAGAAHPLTWHSTLPGSQLFSPTMPSAE